jgi:hypothetical protein
MLAYTGRQYKKTSITTQMEGAIEVSPARNQILQTKIDFAA